MSKDHVDASLGLAFSLSVFERYKKNGLLHAEIHHVPGIRGRCIGYLHLVEGKVTACYVEKNGERTPIAKDILVRVDSDRGPFEWKLQTLPAPPKQRPDAMQLEEQPEEQHPPTPRLIAPLDVERLQGWTATQKLMLSVVYEAIDGKKTVEVIKKEVPLPPNTTEEALRILLALKVIIIIQ